MIFRNQINSFLFIIDIIKIFKKIQVWFTFLWEGYTMANVLFVE